MDKSDGKFGRFPKTFAKWKHGYVRNGIISSKAIYDANNS